MTSEAVGHRCKAAEVAPQKEIVMPSALCLFLALISLLASAARAETWLEVRSEPGKHFLQLDQDSVVSDSDGRYTVTWRHGVTLQKSYFVKNGTVDCASESIKLSSSTYVETDPVLAKLQGTEQVTDYELGKRTFGGRSYDLLESSRLDRFQFPGPGSSEDQLIQRICQKEFSARPRVKSVNEFQQRLGCSSSDSAPTWLCAKDPITLDTLHHLFLRLTQVKARCHTPQAHLESVLDNWLTIAGECRSSKGCGIALLQLDVSGLGGDLSRAANDQVCSYMERSVAAAAEDNEKRDSLTRYKSCVQRSVPALDDLISPADVIASAVHGTCRAELTHGLAQSKDFADAVLPGLSAAVLQQRKDTAKAPKGRSSPKKKVKAP